MEKDNIINYEEIFEEDNKKKELDYEKQRSSSILTITLYVVLFLFGLAAVIFLPFFETKNSNYLVLEMASILDEEHYIYVLNNDDLLVENENFKINNEHIFLYNDVAFIIYHDSIVSLEEEFALDILSGDFISWPDDADNVPVLVYYSKDVELEFLGENAFVVTDNYSVNQEAILSFLVYFLVTVVLVFVNIPKIKYDYSDLFSYEQKPFWGNLFSSLLIMYAISIGLSIVTQVLAAALNLDSVSSNQVAIDLMLKSRYALLVIFTITFLGPLVEELVFRSAIFSLFKNPKTAVIVSAVTFGGIHITTELFGLIGNFTFLSIAQTLIFSIPYIGMGVYLSILYYKNKQNIILLYGVHALYNLVVSILGILVS